MKKQLKQCQKTQKLPKTANYGGKLASNAHFDKKSPILVIEVQFS